MASAVLDADLGNPAVAILHAGAPAPSPIALERGVARPPLAYAVVASVLSLGVLSVCLFFANGAIQAGELAWSDSFAGLADVNLEAGRIAAAAGAGLAVAAAASVGRRLSHSWVAGLLCAALLALDPALLASGMLATPTTLILAAALWSLALVLSPQPVLHWMAGLTLAIGAAMDPAVALWSLPLAAILLLRGHIYMSPEHVGIAFLQVGLLPAVGAFTHLLADGTWRSIPACLDIGRLDALALSVTAQPGVERILLHSPITWLVGAGGLLLLGVGALGVAFARFRVARAPGRLQFRLTVPFHPFLGRGLWVLLLAIFAPTPLVWLVLFALVLAMGTVELADDAPGFGLAIGLVLLAFAAIVLFRSWDAVVGTGGAEGVQQALELVPWTTARSC